MALSAPTFNNFPAKWPAVTGSGIYLRWKSVSGAAKYQVQRKRPDGTWVACQDSGEYYETTSTAAWCYAGEENIDEGSVTFRLRAVNSAGDPGPWTEKTASPFYTPLSPPTNVTAPSSVRADVPFTLTWTINGGDPDNIFNKYTIYKDNRSSLLVLQNIYDRSSNQAEITVLSSWDGDTARFAVGQTDIYGYEVRGQKQYSNETVVIYAPPAPALTTPSLAMEGQTVPVSWTASINATGYILQRKADTDEDWTQVYSGQALSSSETAGAWSWVQYRVKATGEKADSAWATSGEIPVVSASALVISGQDGDLGTLVNDVPYSVSSDTGNQISLELRVNGALWTALEVSSGYAQSIPVIDLPTGAGTIDILATVQASTGAVSAARAWTYTKTPVTTSAGPCDVVEWQDAAGAVKFPITLAEAVRIPGGKTLDQVTQLPAQICTGSYVGTGTYGKDDPTEITFPFVPDLWGYFATVQTSNPGNLCSSVVFSCIPWGLDIPNNIQVLSGFGSATNMQFDGKTVQFYGDDVNGNANAKGMTYWYYAVKIG